MTVSALPLAAPVAFSRRSVPELLADRPIDPATALGRLFAPAADVAGEVALGRFVAAAPRRLLGELEPAAGLLPPIERERAAILAAWVEALLATAREDDALERRLARLNRSAFLLARALAGEPSDAPFVRSFAAEFQRRSFTRGALDALLAVARRQCERPRAETRAEWEAFTSELGAAFATALTGAEPSASTVDAAAALHRLLALRALPRDLGTGTTQLPLSDLAAPLQYRTREEIAAAAAAEADALRPVLLRGARALGEVPLTFRRPLAYLLSTALDLLGQIEVHPAALVTREPRLGWWTRHLTRWRIRRQPLD